MHLLDHLDCCCRGPPASDQYGDVAFCVLTSLSWLQCALEVLGLKEVTSQYQKWVSDPSRRSGTAEYRPVFKYLYQFLMLLVGTPIDKSQYGWRGEVCTQITGRLRGSTSTRCMCLVEDAERYLESEGGWLFGRDCLIRLGGPLALTMKASSSVLSVCSLSDGRVVSGSCDNTVRVWDVLTGTCSVELRGHTNGV